MALGHEEATDARLMVRYQRGDRDAFAELVDRHCEPVYNYALRRISRASLAEALSEQIFLRVVKNAGDFKHEGRFKTWLYGIVFEVCQTPKRSSVRAAEPEESTEGSVEVDTQGFSPAPTPKTPPSAATEKVAIAEADPPDLPTTVRATIQALPELTRDIFLLRHIAGLPPSAIADVVGTDEASVEQEFRHALDRLQEALAGFEEYTRALR